MSQMIDIEGIKTRIKAARREKGLTQAKMGERLGLSYVCVHQWEGGSRTPKLSTINKLASALDCSVEYLLGLQEPQEEKEEAHERDHGGQ